MKILVTGADGQLGMSIRRIAPESGHAFVFTDVKELDITDPAAVRAMVTAEKPDAIVNCAAYTNVDAAEDNPELAELLNATAVGNLAAAAREADALMVHISTDYVFGGDPYNTPCTEDRKGTPTGVYGLTKLHGEQVLQASGARYVIIRTGWLYSEFGRNFVKTMLKLTAERPQVKVVFDQVGTPTYAGDLAAAIFEILRCAQNDRKGAQDDRKGGEILHFVQNDSSCHPDIPSCHPERSEGSIYHFSNEGVCSWFDFARTIAELAGHDSCEVLPCHSDEFPSKVHRPAYSVLDKTKIKDTFGLRIPYWTESLRVCLNNLL